MHQETARTGELVLLLGDDAHRQLFAGQVGARQLVRLRQLGLVNIDGRGSKICATSFQLFEAVLRQLVVSLAGGVVVGCHGRWTPPSEIPVLLVGATCRCNAVAPVLFPLRGPLNHSATSPVFRSSWLLGRARAPIVP